MSAAPPGVEGAMMRTGRVGQSAALAGPIKLQVTAKTSAAARRLMVCSSGCMMRALPRARKLRRNRGRSLAGGSDFRLGNGPDVFPHRRWSEIAHGRGFADGGR